MGNNFFCIRDDDINYLTDYKKLQSFYGEVIDFARPTFCVTPYAGEIYSKIRDSEYELLTSKSKFEYVKTLVNINPSIKSTTYSIYDNSNLIALLKDWCDSGLIEICMHGITHNQTEKCFECEGELNSKKLQDARDELAQIFNVEINLFSPPNNSISRAWIKDVERNNMNIVHSVGPRPSEMPLNINSILSTLVVIGNYILKGKDFRIERPLRYGSELHILPSYPLSPQSSFDGIYNRIFSGGKENSAIVAAIHSYAFIEHGNFYDQFLKMIKLAKAENYNFSTISDYINKYLINE